ncbi:MAG TPA: lipopolysaccharide biosynthesis protein [Pyrinomonadaceae bacterium]|jgi:PST family polysaccharide transporter|nr:lipopolysaccharide biosynthesis protein [Pyrinomonadaceae bacterium]
MDKNFQTEHLKVNLGGRVARGGAVAITSQGLKFFVTLAATSIMARLLTPQDYGLIGMVAFVTGFVSMYKDLGLSAATIQKSEITAEQISTLFWVNLSLSLIITLLTMGIAPLVAWFYGEPRLTSITVVSSLGFLISGLAVQPEALLRRQMRYFALAITGIGSVIVGYVVGIIMAWRGFSYWALVGSQLAVIITGTGMTLLFCRWVPGLPKRRTGVRSMIRFGGNLTGFTTINYFSRNLDNLLIGRVVGAQQLGLYSRAYQLMALPIDQINEPMGSVAIPSLSRLKDSPESYRRAYLRMLEKIAMLTMPGVILMIITSDWIIHILLGPQWIGAVRIFVILGTSALFQPIANTTGWLLISQGRTQDLLKWGLISGPIIITSFLIGLPWGAVGVATSYTTARIFVVDPLLYWFVGREGPVKTMDFYKTMAPFVFSSVCALLAGIAFRKWSYIDSGFWIISICVIITAVTTLVTLAITSAGRAALYDVKTSALLLVGRTDRVSSHS